MEKRKLIFNRIIELGFANKTAYAYLSGTRKPNYETMVRLDRDGIVPFHAWLDIKAYLNKDDSSPKGNTTTPQEG